MFQEQKIITEYLSELNTFLSQMDPDGNLKELLVPVRNYMQAQKDLISFSLCRYCGANAQISFFCEWFAQVWFLSKNQQYLFKYNQEYWRNKVPTTLRGLPNLYNLVDTHIYEHFLPFQLLILHTETQRQMQRLYESYRFLQRYLRSSLFKDLIASQVFVIGGLYTHEEIATSKYLKNINYQISYIQIAIPCLLGLRFHFYESRLATSPDNIQWLILEEVLENISALHYTRNSNRIAEFLYQNSISDQQKFRWWQLTDSEKRKILEDDADLKHNTLDIRNKIFQKTKTLIPSTELPVKNQQLLLSLLHWSWQQEDNQRQKN